MGVAYEWTRIGATYEGEMGAYEKMWEWLMTKTGVVYG